MVQVLSLTALALLVARVLRAPRGSWRVILGVAAGLLLATQLLPGGHPLRTDVAGSARGLFWLALALVPVAAYALVLRRIRRRNAAQDAPAQRSGLVQIAADAALVAETQAALDTEAGRAGGSEPETLSLAWRTENGALAGHLRLRRLGARGEVEALHVRQGHRRRGIGSALLAAGEAELVARGVTRIGALIEPWQAAQFLARRGYADRGEAGRRRWVEKPLP